MTIGLLILGVFVVAAALMFFRVLPAVLALPLMAIAIVLVEVASGTLTIGDLSAAVLADGATRLADAMVIAMLGGMLSAFMQKAGVAESFVRRGAELAGDSPWTVALVMLAIVTLLFTTIGGLGAVIMVGTIVLPILASMGMREHVSAGLFLMGLSLGGLLNAGNWTVYRTVLGLDAATVTRYALALFVVVGAVSIGFVTVELWRTRALEVRRRGLARGLAGATGLAVVVALAWARAPGGLGVMTLARWAIALAGAGLVAAALVRAVRGSAHHGGVHWSAYAIPLVPLALILVFQVPFVPAFLVGLAYAVLSTYRRGILNTTTRAVIEGSASVMPAVVLMIGIGMLLSAVLGPTPWGPGRAWYAARPPGTEWPVLAHMKPVLGLIVPGSFAGYVATFTLLGPLALYRGPLNVWGLGYGVGGVLLATGVPAGAVMGVLMSLGMIQGISDPTNTANVWLANEVRLDVTTLMWRTLPYAWLAAFGGLVIAGLWFRP